MSWLVSQFGIIKIHSEEYAMDYLAWHTETDNDDDILQNLLFQYIICYTARKHIIKFIAFLLNSTNLSMKFSRSLISPIIIGVLNMVSILIRIFNTYSM